MRSSWPVCRRLTAPPRPNMPARAPRSRRADRAARCRVRRSRRRGQGSRDRHEGTRPSPSDDPPRRRHGYEGSQRDRAGCAGGSLPMADGDQYSDRRCPLTTCNWRTAMASKRASVPKTSGQASRLAYQKGTGCGIATRQVEAGSKSATPHQLRGRPEDQRLVWRTLGPCEMLPEKPPKPA
jgi:hypothetical protein